MSLMKKVPQQPIFRLTRIDHDPKSFGTKHVPDVRGCESGTEGINCIKIGLVDKKAHLPFKVRGAFFLYCSMDRGSLENMYGK